MYQFPNWYLKPRYAAPLHGLNVLKQLRCSTTTVVYRICGRYILAHPKSLLRANSVSSMPLTLAHEPFLQSAILKVSDEVAVASSASLSTLCSSTAPPSRAARISIRKTIRWWRIVGRTWLQADRLGRIEMTCDSLNCCRNPSLLLFHR